MVSGMNVLITGCSSGFGLLTAVTLAGQGHRVFATMRDPAKRAALDTAAERAGVGVEVLRLDVRDPGSIADAVGQMREAAGGIDVVVHNAGVAHAGFFEDQPDETVREVYETNFFGVLALTREVLPGMRERRSGRIVVVSSNSAFMPEPTLSAYASSKCAVEGWAQSLAVEVHSWGIDVVLIEPGTYRTEIWTSAIVARPPDSVYRAFAEVVEAKVRARVAQSARDPQEVADRIAKVVGARRPHLRHPVGRNSWTAWAMGRFLPFPVRRRLLAKATGLDTVPLP
jgi:NAD(P)-dependent dehydrogenase (short-subunit alcohol dehydrogenase family)